MNDDVQDKNDKPQVMTQGTKHQIANDDVAEQQRGYAANAVDASIEVIDNKIQVPRGKCKAAGRRETHKRCHRAHTGRRVRKTTQVMTVSADPMKAKCTGKHVPEHRKNLQPGGSDPVYKSKRQAVAVQVDND
jgi:hypothetical protein